MQDSLTNHENIATNGPRTTAAANFGSRIEKTLIRIRNMIPSEIISVENHVLNSNRNKIVIALLNFVGSVGGVYLNWPVKNGTNNVANTIEVFSNIVAGYGYWGRYALELQEIELKCGPLDFERVLDEYSRVVKYKKGSFDPIFGAHFTSELTGKIRESLYCLIANPSYPKNKVKSELDTYVKIYTKLLFWIIKDLEKAPVT